MRTLRGVLGVALLGVLVCFSERSSSANEGYEDRFVESKPQTTNTGYDTTFNEEQGDQNSSSSSVKLKSRVERVLDLNEKVKINHRNPCLESSDQKGCPSGFTRSFLSSSNQQIVNDLFELLEKESQTGKGACFSEKLIQSYLESRAQIPREQISDLLLLKILASLSTLKKGEEKKFHFVQGEKWGGIERLPSGVTRIYFFGDKPPESLEAAAQDGSRHQIGSGNTKKTFAEFVFKKGILSPAAVLVPAYDSDSHFERFEKEALHFLRLGQALRSTRNVNLPKIEEDIDGNTLMVGDLYDETLADQLIKGFQEETPKSSHSRDRYLIGLGMIRGLQALHKKNIVWNDAKPDNVLIRNKIDAALTDLGEARYLEPQKGKVFFRYGDIRFIAPEADQKMPMETKADLKRILKRDVFGIALMLDALHFPGQHPKENYNLTTSQRVEMNRDFERAKVNRQAVWASYRESELERIQGNEKKDPLKELLLECMQPNPEMRPSSRSLLKRYRAIMEERTR